MNLDKFLSNGLFKSKTPAVKPRFTLGGKKSEAAKPAATPATPAAPAADTSALKKKYGL
jgi:hypothetical protein